MNQTTRFMEALFAAKPDQEYILIWLLSGRRSAWFRDVTAAAGYVDDHRAEDVYVGVALSPADHGPRARLKIEGGERMPSSIVGLWADLDIANPGHKKKNLAPSAEDARSILHADMPPSILLHSGGGLQAWWLFREPWSLETEQETREAGALATRWIRAIRARAAARGWDIDAVGDLTRVLRVPGTSNCKIPGQPRPVELLELNHRRYNPSELDEYLDMIGAEHVSTKAISSTCGEKLTYSRDVDPPFQRFQTLCDVDPKFKLAWDHARKDLRDQSASAYDMALANTAVCAGWTDQEIADLLIAHRRRYNEDLKLRDSYYAKTIAKARAALTNGDVIRELEDLTTPDPGRGRDVDGEKKPLESTTEDPLQKKAALVDRLSRVFELTDEFRIVRIVRYLSEPHEYAIEIANGGCIRLGGVTSLIEPRALQAKIAELAGRMIPRFSRNAQWGKIQQALLDACVDVPVGDEGTDAGLVRSWLVGYLAAKPVLSSIEESAETRSPFERDGRIHLYLSDLRRWIHIAHGDRIAPKELCIKLRRTGAVDVKVAMGRTSRQVWALAESFVPPPKHGPPAWVTDEPQGEELVN